MIPRDRPAPHHFDESQLTHHDDSHSPDPKNERGQPKNSRPKTKEALKTDIEQVLEESVANAARNLQSQDSSHEISASFPVDETPTKFVDIRKKFEQIIRHNFESNLGNSLSSDLRMITQSSFSNQNGVYYNGYGGITGAPHRSVSLPPTATSNP